MDSKSNKIAYLILAHNNPSTLRTLIDTLSDGKNDFYVHIDKKTVIDPFVTAFKGISNVYFLDDNMRYKVFWGGFSQIKATFSLIRTCLERATAEDFRYIKCVLLSGACFPIKSNSYIDQFFAENKQVNFIRGMNITAANDKKYNFSIRRYLFFDFQIFKSKNITRYVRKLLSLLFFPLRKKNYIQTPTSKLDVFHGSQWWALNQDVLEYINTFDKRALDKYFKFSLASDEKYFHTIFFNSTYSKTDNHEGPEKFFPATFAFANLHIIHESLQKWFTIDDKIEIEQSKKIFVRKVSLEKSKELFDYIKSLQ